MRPSPIARLVLVLVLALCAGLADADVPRKIHYQAVIKSPAGVPVEGLTDLRIQIFDAQTGGSSLWGENPILEVKDGRLDLVLPVLEPEGFAQEPWDAMLASSELWLEIVARPENGGVDITFPRQQILTSGFSLGTASIDGALGGTIVGGLELSGDITLPDGIEIRTQGGSLIIDSPASSITIAPDGTLTIQSTSVEILSSGSLDLQGTSVSISGQSVDIQAAGTLNAQGALVTIN